MKHESMSKIRLAKGNGDCNQKQTSKRVGLWRMRSLSEAPASTPQSPITKAFNFLPWSRGKRNTESKAKSPSPPLSKIPAASPTTTKITVNTNATDTTDEQKDAALHNHRNIFRSVGGGLIRDLLSDRLQKDKTNEHNFNESSNKINNNKTQKKFKQLVTRNKSLDINELIQNVENNDEDHLVKGTTTIKHMLPRHGSKQHFLDDTYIENMARDKSNITNWYNDSDETNDDHDANVSGFYDPETGFYQKAPTTITGPETQLRSSFHIAHNNNGSTASNASKHILFNDENVVYLIKKELPVKKRDCGKVVDTTRSTKKSNSTTHSGNSSNMSSPRSSFRNSNEQQQNDVLRARLKFKKYAPDSNNHTLTASWNHQQPPLASSTKSLSRNRNYETIAKSSSNILNDTLNNNRRSILQRQNTSPALVEATNAGTLMPSPILARNQVGGSMRRRNPTDPIIKNRRKSLTEMLTNERQQQNMPQSQQQKQQTQCYTHSSSSSSMGSGGSNSQSAALPNERSRSEKPRKKLSFREPIVTEKERLRRLSSPIQRSSMEFGGSDLTDFDLDQIHPRSKVAYAESSNKHYTLQDPKSLDMIGGGEMESQAMRIVRTVGQAFEVCHKFNFHKNSVDHNNDERSDVSSELLDVERISEQQQISDEETNKKEQMTTAVDLNHAQPPPRPNHLDLISRASPSSSQIEDDKSQITPSSPSHEIIKLKDQLEQQALQTRQALAQLMLVREQLISETNARIEAQARTQQLLQQNRELLEHLASLGAYTEQQTAGLTSANIAMAPQSQLQMLLQATSNNNNLATINQQISNLGSINQQLTSLSHQLSGLNQQSQNLQNFQNIQNLNANLQQQQAQQQTQQSSQQQQQQQQSSNLTSLSSLLATPSSTTTLTTTSPYPSISQLQTISNQLQQINAHSAQQQLQQDTLSKDLLQVNQELLNRLQTLNLNAPPTATPTATATLQAAAAAAAATTPNNSFFYVNPMSCSPQPTNNNNNSNSNNNNNNNMPSNFNFLNSSTSLLSNAGGGIGIGNNGNNNAGNLTPSPMSTLNRNSYTHSPIADLDSLRLSMDKNLNRVDELSLLTKLPTVASNGNLSGISAGQNSNATTTENSRSTSTLDSQSSPRSRSANETAFQFNTVTLRVTDEAGNVTNQRKLSATPSFITRSTSEKVPNRSQMMSEVQRTTWARHTTK